MSTSPRVTVILPTFNAGRYLEPAVRSVLNQTWRDFELLVLDDGSSDTSAEVLGRLAAEDRRIVNRRRENRGLAATLNELITLARGEYVARMDADDLCYPDRLRLQVQFLDNSPSHVAVGGRVVLIDDDGEQIGIRDDMPCGAAQIDAMLLAGEWPVVHPTLMVRRAILIAVGCYNERFRANEDHDLFLRLSEAGPVSNLPDVVLAYRQTCGSLSKRHEQANEQDMAIALALARRRRGLPEPTRVPALQCTDTRPGRFNLEWARMASTQNQFRTARKHLGRALHSDGVSVPLVRCAAFMAWELLRRELRRLIETRDAAFSRARLRDDRPRQCARGEDDHRDLDVPRQARRSGSYRW
jgi:Glycosyl transferase family 2